MSISSITNCPNCGAPIDRSRDSCEYCGTPYPEKPETAKLYADNQLVMEVQIEANKRSDELLKQLLYDSMTAWQPTPEEERKIIDKLKYEREKELMHDILGVLILLGPAIIASVITWFLIH